MSGRDARVNADDSERIEASRRVGMRRGVIAISSWWLIVNGDTDWPRRDVSARVIAVAGVDGIELHLGDGVTQRDVQAGDVLLAGEERRVSREKGEGSTRDDQKDGQGNHKLQEREARGGLPWRGPNESGMRMA